MKGKRLTSTAKLLVGALLFAALALVLLPAAAQAASEPDKYIFDVAEGNVIIDKGSTPGTLKVTYGASTVLDNIEPNQMITITGSSTSNRIIVEKGFTVNITLKDVDINLSGNCAFYINDNNTVHLTLVGNNFLQNSSIGNAGLRVVDGASLTITGGETDKLTASGGSGGAGIGGGYDNNGGTIIINGGIIKASGGNFAAGIGGGESGAGGTVTINGGIIEASGGYGGAGIGGGESGAGGTVTINGGTVKATGDIGGAGIGGGIMGPGGTFTINGGTVKATGDIGGAGIGGAIDKGRTVITGGTVNASSILGTPTNGTDHGNQPLSLTVVTLPSVSSETEVVDLTIAGASYYGTADLYTDSEGKLYFWLPDSSEVTQVKTANKIYNLNSSTGTWEDDTTPPTVTNLTPSGTGAPVSGSLEVTFSEEMRTDTGAVSLDDGATALPGGSWNAEKTVYTVPYSGLAYGTAYRVTISSFRDYSGNLMADDTGRSFTTVANDATLSRLTVSPGTLNPAFAASITDYSAVVEKSVDSITLTASVNEPNASMTLKKDDGAAEPWDGTASVQSLSVGANLFTITVTAQDGTTTMTYTVTVTRAGDSGTSATPTYKATLSAANIAGSELPVTVNLNTGNAAIDLSALAGSIFSSGGATIAVPPIPGVNSYTLEIPAASLSGSQGKSALTFSTPLASITIPSDMLAGIPGTEGKKAGITIGRGDKSSLPEDVQRAIGNRPLIQLTMTLDGMPTEWNNPNAPVTVSIPYTPTEEELANPAHITVWYLDGSGTPHAVDGRYDPASGTVIFSTTHFSYYAVVYDSVIRLAGTDRVGTALRIAQAAYPGKIKNAVLTTAANYPDALAGSVLAYKLDAPVLLLGSSESDQQKVIQYLKANLEPEGRIYILGGTSVVGSGIEEKLRNSGLSRISRIAGGSRYDTAAAIAEQLNVAKGTPVVLVSGENYPDALAISSMAAQNQYPILLVAKDGISEAVSWQIAAIQPSKMIVIGLEGAIGKEVENQAAALAGLTAEHSVRIGGTDRYVTSLEIAAYFNSGNRTVCLATGTNFPDALAGSVYAAKAKAPIILTSSSLPQQTADYLRSETPAKAVIFGGETVVGKDLERLLRELAKL